MKLGGTPPKYERETKTRRALNKAAKDEALRKKVNQASDHIVKVAKEHGFEVTGEEVKVTLKEHWDDDPASGVLSEMPGF